VLSAREGLDDDHRGAAVSAQEGGSGAVVIGAGIAGLSGRHWRRLMPKIASSGNVVLAVGVGEQAVMADPMKARGQHVQQEAAHELRGRQGHRFVARPSVLSRLFRRRFLEELQNAHRGGQLKFFGEHIDLADADTFADWLTPLRQCEWVVYAKRPFAGPEQVLAYLSRYTHRVAISNSRLLALDDRGVTFRWKDYRETLAPLTVRHGGD